MQNRLSIAVGFDASLEDEVTGGKKDDRIIKAGAPSPAAIGANAEDKGRICPFACAPEAPGPARNSTFRCYAA